MQIYSSLDLDLSIFILKIHFIPEGILHLILYCNYFRLIERKGNLINHVILMECIKLLKSASCHSIGSDAHINVLVIIRLLVNLLSCNETLCMVSNFSYHVQYILMLLLKSNFQSRIFTHIFLSDVFSFS